jgi:hypothetical protein
VQRDRAFGRKAKVVVARLGAEMRQVNQGHGIGGADREHGPCCKCHQTLARPKHGQRAQQPLAVQYRIAMIHPGDVAAAGPCSKVTAAQRGCDLRPG